MLWAPHLPQNILLESLPIKALARLRAESQSLSTSRCKSRLVTPNLATLTHSCACKFLELKLPFLCRSKHRHKIVIRDWQPQSEYLRPRKQRTKLLRTQQIDRLRFLPNPFPRCNPAKQFLIVM